uniref:Uncharacterized protein n=1 Tax=Setaria digitata TaxID=48799 RepID=A0A915PR91_9BILA
MGQIDKIRISNMSLNKQVGLPENKESGKINLFEIGRNAIVIISESEGLEGVDGGHSDGEGSRGPYEQQAVGTTVERMCGRAAKEAGGCECIVVEGLTHGRCCAVRWALRRAPGQWQTLWQKWRGLSTEGAPVTRQVVG